jgi:hypothetical protein
MHISNIVKNLASIYRKNEKKIQKEKRVPDKNAKNT